MPIRGTTMRFAIALAFTMLATLAWPCSKPETGTIETLMEQATWTVRTGNLDTAEVLALLPNRSRMAKVAIALPAIGRGDEAFRCLTWNVELITPPSIGVRTNSDGNTGDEGGEGQEGGETSYTGLASTETAEFDLELPALRGGAPVRDWRAWLRVKVHFPSDGADVFLSKTGGSDVWLYPVTVQMAY